jgi:hypothetical protein
VALKVEGVVEGGVFSEEPLGYSVLFAPRINDPKGNHEAR